MFVADGMDKSQRIVKIGTMDEALVAKLPVDKFAILKCCDIRSTKEGSFVELRHPNTMINSRKISMKLLGHNKTRMLTVPCSGSLHVNKNFRHAKFYLGTRGNRKHESFLRLGFSM
jgi:hypothetical protein